MKGVLAASAALVLACAGSLRAQNVFDPSGGDVFFRAEIHGHQVHEDRPLVRAAGPYIVVHLAENRVYLFEGRKAVWSAPAGTGTGFRLDRGKHRWKFSTPRGMFRIQRMEKDPLWEAPDWLYAERGLPIPPPDHPRQQMKGVMGTTAIYLGDGIAIHGTDQPQLVLRPDPEHRRVSHGCIRLTNEAARTLMHMVHVGTPVLIY